MFLKTFGFAIICVIIGFAITSSSLIDSVSIKYGGNICYKPYCLIWHVKDAMDN